MPAFPNADTSGSKGIDVEWFATDIVITNTPNDNARQIRITFAASAGDANYEFTIDSGTTWVKIPTVVAEEIVTILLAMREGDNFNIRHRVGATTVRFCRIDEIAKEVAG